tara:strand:+ start:1816 stop:2082 length:267 start_codon:yes stop_codon:yes gene_type:complete
MKKLSIILLSVFLFSCTSENLPADEGPELDCDCYRVTNVTYFSVVGTTSPSITYHCNYTAVNDCTQIEINVPYVTTNQNSIPKVGDCR